MITTLPYNMHDMCNKCYGITKLRDEFEQCTIPLTKQEFIDICNERHYIDIHYIAKGKSYPAWKGNVIKVSSILYYIYMEEILKKYGNAEYYENIEFKESVKKTVNHYVKEYSAFDDIEQIYDDLLAHSCEYMFVCKLLKVPQTRHEGVSVLDIRESGYNTKRYPYDSVRTIYERRMLNVPYTYFDVMKKMYATDRKKLKETLYANMKFYFYKDSIDSLYRIIQKSCSTVKPGKIDLNVGEFEINTFFDQVKAYDDLPDTKVIDGVESMNLGNDYYVPIDYWHNMKL